MAKIANGSTQQPSTSSSSSSSGRQAAAANTGTSTSSTSSSKITKQKNKRKQSKPMSLSHYVLKKSECVHCRHQISGGCAECGSETEFGLYMQHLMRSVHPLLAQAPFRRLVREIATDLKVDIRISSGAYEALQESAEHWLNEHFQLAFKFAKHAQRKTVTIDDFKLAKQMLKNHVSGTRCQCLWIVALEHFNEYIAAVEDEEEPEEEEDEEEDEIKFVSTEKSLAHYFECRFGETCKFASRDEKSVVEHVLHRHYLVAKDAHLGTQVSPDSLRRAKGFVLEVPGQME